MHSLLDRFNQLMSQSIYLSIYQSNFFPSLASDLHPLHPYITPSIHSLIHSPVYLSICIHLSVCFFFYLSVHTLLPITQSIFTSQLSHSIPSFASNYRVIVYYDNNFKALRTLRLSRLQHQNLSG